MEMRNLREWQASRQDADKEEDEEDTEEWVRTEAELGACNARWEVDMAAMQDARRDQKEKAGPEALQLLTRPRARAAKEWKRTRRSGSC